MTTREIWRLVPSVPAALASSHGRVMLAPFPANGPRAGHKQHGGRPTPGQWDGSRFIWRCEGKTYKVARLVCEAFNGPPPFDRAVCMHMDENSRNNVPSNLKWGTQKENLSAPGFIEYCRSRTGDNSPIAKAKKKAA